MKIVLLVIIVATLSLASARKRIKPNSKADIGIEMGAISSNQNLVKENTLDEYNDVKIIIGKEKPILASFLTASITAKTPDSVNTGWEFILKSSTNIDSKFKSVFQQVTSDNTQSWHLPYKQCSSPFIYGHSSFASKFISTTFEYSQNENILIKIEFPGKVRYIFEKDDVLSHLAGSLEINRVERRNSVNLAKKLASVAATSYLMNLTEHKMGQKNSTEANNKLGEISEEIKSLTKEIETSTTKQSETNSQIETLRKELSDKESNLNNLMLDLSSQKVTLNQLEEGMLASKQTVEEKSSKAKHYVEDLKKLEFNIRTALKQLQKENQLSDFKIEEWERAILEDKSKSSVKLLLNN